MTHDHRRCPSCRTEMTLTYHELTEEQATNLGLPSGQLGVWHCPRSMGPYRHQPDEPCPNCDELVPSREYHYDYTPGLIGSGKYSCFRIKDFDAKAWEEGLHRALNRD